MDPSSLSSAVAVGTLPAPYAPPIRPTRTPPPSTGACAGNGSAVSAESTQRVTEDHYRIIQDQKDVVVSLFAAGLDLQAALQLIGDGRVADHIGDAIDSLDQAIRDHRDIVFHRGADDS